MIGFFPTPYPDELLYSICARYSARLQWQVPKFINLDLFGNINAVAIVDLPCRLSNLYFNLPAGNYYTEDVLIDLHSLYPFYAPFLPIERLDRIREAMKGAGGSVIHKFTGITASTIRLPNWLRYCPTCVKENRKRFGECYWHRIHQVPGVHVCPNHSVYLENSIVLARNRPNDAIYFSAEKAVAQDIPPAVSTKGLFGKHLLNLALDVRWLIKQRGLASGYSILRSGYLKILSEQGKTTLGARTRLDEIIQAIRAFYPSAVLQKLQCDFDNERENNWPSRLIKQLNQNKVNHPLRHLLLIRAIGHTAESFFKLCDENRLSNNVVKVKPFGDGPWPCHNPVCPQFNKPVISIYKLSSLWRNPGIPTGNFRCDCGFAYMRKGPDRSFSDRFKRHLLKSYGPLWEKALREKWKDTALSINKMSLQLGVSDSTIKNQAIRLGLPFPRYGPGAKIARIDETVLKMAEKKRNVEAQWKKQRDENRQGWLSARKKHPNAGRKLLQLTLVPRAYSWLYKHDNEWLKENMPPVYQRIGSARKVDWKSRDERLSRAVRQTAQQLRDRPGPPLQVGVKTIGRTLDKTALLTRKKSLNKLPLTKKALTEEVESSVDFCIRRIKWAVEYCKSENIRPSLPKLAIKAGMTWNTWQEPKIKAVLVEAWQSLQNITTDNLQAT